MTFQRPTLPELASRCLTDIQARLPGSDALLRRSNFNILSRLMAGVAHGLYGYLDYLAKQMIYDTAEGWFLERWASIWKITRLPGSFFVGSATCTNSNVVDHVLIPAGTELQRSDGVLYLTNSDVVIPPGSSSTVLVTAGAVGAASNTATAVNLTLTNPIAYISSVVLTGVVSSGADIELDDSLRSRLLSRIQTPPHGGARFDYEAWAMSVPGVTRAWVTSNYTIPNESMAAGAVKVRFVRDNDATGIIPDAAEVAAVQSALDAVRPVTVALTVAAPTAVPLNFSINPTPDTAAVRATIKAELKDLIAREAIPINTTAAAGSNPTTTDPIYLSHIRAAISAAAGETNYTMTAPAADITNSIGSMTTLGQFYYADGVTAWP